MVQQSAGLLRTLAGNGGVKDGDRGAALGVSDVMDRAGKSGWVPVSHSLAGSKTNPVVYTFIIFF